MIETAIWWLTIEIVGLAALPLALRVFRFLPDRGYAFARPLGLLLAAYALWLGATFGLLANQRATIAVLVAGIGGVCWWRWRGEVERLWAERRSLVVVTEIVFVVALAVWTLIRAYDPAIAGTEKPMEFAFINAILRSISFPPPDPWLAGYSISYYYFGYLMMSMLIKLSGLASNLTFGLIGALLFALCASGVFSLGFNLAEAMRRRRHSSAEPSEETGFVLRAGPVICGLLAVLFLLVLGNLEGLFEVLNARQAISPALATSLQIKDMPAPYLSQTGMPSDNWWWWRASRVIGDFDPLTKASRDYTINEFPFFSFILGDVHPHVLALPFVLMALALSLNILRAPLWTWWRSLPRTLLLALCFGALGFLNTWDMPTFLAIFIVAFAAGRFAGTRRFDMAWLGHWLSFGAAVAVLGILLYLPFYLTFSSQASGIGVVMVRTQLKHFLIFWAPFLLLSLSYLGWQLARWARGGLRLPLGTLSDERGTVRPEFELAPAAVIALGAVALGIGYASFRAGIPVLGMLVPALAAGLALLLRWSGLQAFPAGAVSSRAESNEARETQGEDAGREQFFILLLVVFAFALVAFCELFFLRDLFGNRMNTVFKFYYQAWVLLAVAGAAVVYSLASAWRRAATGWRLAGTAWGLVTGLVVLAALVYPAAATVSKANGFAPAPSLDGMGSFARFQGDDYRAIAWLSANAPAGATVVEAAGGSYSQAGRVSMATGLPDLLGWDFHERQWRGAAVDAETNARKRALESIYRAGPDARSLLKQYGASYIYVGSLEREAYIKQDAGALDRLSTLGDIVYRQGPVTIYRVRE